MTTWPFVLPGASPNRSGSHPPAVHLSAELGFVWRAVRTNHFVCSLSRIDVCLFHYLSTIFFFAISSYDLPTPKRKVDCLSLSQRGAYCVRATGHDARRINSKDAGRVAVVGVDPRSPQARRRLRAVPLGKAAFGSSGTIGSPTTVAAFWDIGAADFAAHCGREELAREEKRRRKRRAYKGALEALQQEGSAPPDLRHRDPRHVHCGDRRRVRGMVPGEELHQSPQAGVAEKEEDRRPRGGCWTASRTAFSESGTTRRTCGSSSSVTAPGKGQRYHALAKR